MAEAFCYLTTTGRRTGRAHTIEIWFGQDGDAGTLYLLSGGGDGADWVRNGRATPEVTVRIGSTSYDARFRLVDDPDEDALARRLLLEKYDDKGELADWGRRSLAVALDLR
ncbi:MAG TPA: nitroreductase family deazaflavin-dependent oxidoreductase [Acidimicrobiales bacterium]|nr:nitroreductase family deazaflavin-dependent oxidoreductase [Acidimicrobiales bacterium]